MIHNADIDDDDDMPPPWMMKSHGNADDGWTVVTDAETGGRKGAKLEAFHAIPADALLEIARHTGRGVAKYPDADGRPNFHRGYAWSLSFDAMMRHMWQWQLGQDRDEDGNRHLAAAAWHAIALLMFEMRDLGTDDRP